MALTELLEVVGGDRKSLARQLDRLRAKGLVDYVEVGPTAPGKPAGLWSLTTEGRIAAGIDSEIREAVRTPDTAAAETGHLRSGAPDFDPDEVEEPTLRALLPGQVWVTAKAGTASRADFRSLLADGELIAAASWIAQLDGDAALYLFAFEPQVGNQPVENLVAALEAIGAVCASGMVRAAGDARAFRDSARTAAASRTRATPLGRSPDP